MDPAPSICIVDAQLETIDCRTRLPFRFGIHTLTAAPYATAVVEVECRDGSETQRVRGAASDLLVPKWFEKNPKLTPEQDSANLAASAEAAFAIGRELTADSVFGLWHSLYQLRVASQPRDQADLLVRGFGVALLERAMMDAVCRLRGVSFHQALKQDLFGFRPGAVHDELAEWNLAADLPAQPLHQIQLRHTVGLLDALSHADFHGDHDSADAPTADPADGFPTTLEDDVRAYGLQWFKIKVAGRGQADVDRMLGIAEVLQSCGVQQPRFTLDGNEQFTDMAQLADMLTQVQQNPLGAEFLRGLAFIEQPLSRDHTFDPQRNAAIADVKKFAPLIIDEADFGTWAFPDAINLGYDGISIKACKGVFRALLNRGICATRNASADADSSPLFQSGEDLTNLPVRALQQDLCLMASLGIEHVERNGHHYFRGLDHLPATEAEQIQLAHPDLYRREQNTTALSINNGWLNVESLNSPGFGCRLDP